MARTTNPEEETRIAFQRAVEHTRTLSPATFDQWFGGIQLDDLTDGVLSLRAQNEFVLDWVKANFLPTLTDKLRELTGWSVQVVWTIDPNLTSPVASRPQMPPVRPRPILVRPSTPPPAPPEPERRRPAATPDELNPKHTFATFVVGPSNQLAHAAAVAAAGGGGRRYNPLFICGGTGLGKTHLMHAIAHRVHDGAAERRASSTCPRSVSRTTSSRRSSTIAWTTSARSYRTQCDVLLVDDIQFLAGPRADAGGVLPHVQRAPHGGPADRGDERQVPAAPRAHGGAAGVALLVGARGGHPGAGARDARRHRAEQGRARGRRPARRRGRSTSRR
jgi:chromosomal replication initiator protein